MADAPSRVDSFARFRGFTPARIGLGRVGAGLPTAAMLAFQLAQARARDAVYAELDLDRLAADLGRPVIFAETEATARANYLQNPDLGRRLAGAPPLPAGPFDAAIVIADGLSAIAVNAHAPAVIAALLPGLTSWRLAPLIAVRHGRVAIGDDIAERLGAKLVLVLIGERPGLSAPDSLGAYLTWAPRRGTPDSARNCVSNIRTPDGLFPGQAAEKLLWLMQSARANRLTGTALKDRSDDAVTLIAPG